MTDADSSRKQDEAQVVTTASIEGLADEWDDLAIRTGAPPFARPGWIRAWWSAFGRGEPRILTARCDGELRSVLPLTSFRGRLSSCSNVHSPVFDGICSEPGDLRILLSAALREGRRGLILRQLDTEGRLCAATRLLEGEERSRLVVLETRISPYVDTTADWEKFEEALTKSRRQKVRRTQRRLGEQGEIAIEVSDGTEDLDRDLSEFLQLEGSGWKVEKGTAIHLQPETQRFYQEMAAWAASIGLLRLSFMRVGGRPVAVECTIDDGAHRYLLKLGYDPEFARYGPGVILQLTEVRRALEEGRTYEMGTGMNKIKEELMNAQRTIEDVAVFPRSARGALARRTVGVRQVAYRRARGSTLLRRSRDAVRRVRSRRRAPSGDSSAEPNPQRQAE
jgi:CelD/BcsL family acetyltransferase involved in cellulose biosynthesis